MSLQKTVNLSYDEILKDLKSENDNYRRELQIYKNRMIELQRGNGANINQ
jgi:hypothetical protein